MKFLVVLTLCIATVAGYGYGHSGGQGQTSPPMSSKPSSYGGYHQSGQGSPSNSPIMEILQMNTRLQDSSSSSTPQILRLHQEIRENQSNNVNFETSNGIRSEDNTQILPGTPNPSNPSELWNRISKSGFYSYTSPEGVPVDIHWTADGVNGFRATGAAIPVAPPA